MQEVFKNIIEKLEKKVETAKRIMVPEIHDELDRIANETAESFIEAYKESIEIIKQEADMYNNAIIDGKYCFQTCACTEKCDKCSRFCNGGIDWYENIDNWTEYYNNGWIPCSSGVMPRANGWYLVTNHLGVVQEQRWSANQWEKLRDDAVLAWMPLPQPYQPKEII